MKKKTIKTEKVVPLVFDEHTTAVVLEEAR